MSDATDIIKEALNTWDGDALVTKAHIESLVDHLASEVFARVWDEGFIAGEQDVLDHKAWDDWNSECIRNPYRTYELGEYSHD